MANISERRNKDGKLISYSIRIHRGRDADGKQLKPFTATFEVQPTWTESAARKKALAYAAQLEAQVKSGLKTDARTRLDAYCRYFIELKQRNGLKPTTAALYEYLCKRIFPALGHIKVSELRADHLNTFYSELQQAKKADGSPLSTKTIIEHARFLGAVLQQAKREALVTTNVARLATPPKRERKEVHSYEPELIAKINAALEGEALKWKAFVHLLMVTGARRGELLGLRWNKIDFEQSRIFIDSTILYTATKGVYESTPKTERSRRYVSLPEETMRLLQIYKQQQLIEYATNKVPFGADGYVFAQPDGSPMHPSSVKNFFARFEKRHGLPHLNAHAFRHTVASLLIYGGADVVSVAQRLGHSETSTTLDIYSHALEKADRENTEIIRRAFLQNA